MSIKEVYSSLKESKEHPIILVGLIIFGFIFILKLMIENMDSFTLFLQYITTLEVERDSGQFILIKGVIIIVTVTVTIIGIVTIVIIIDKGFTTRNKDNIDGAIIRTHIEQEQMKTCDERSMDEKQSVNEHDNTNNMVQFKGELKKGEE